MHALSSADFFKINIFEKLFQESVKQFGSRSGCMFCRAGLGLNCLQRLSSDDTSRQRIIAANMLLPLGGLISSYLSLLPVVFTGLSNVG